MKIKILSLIILLFSIGKIAAQTSGSNDWVWQYPKPQGNTLRDIYVFNDDTAIAVGDLSTIIKTTDGGNTWNVQSNVSPSQKLFCVQFIDANNGWAAGGNYLLKTSDGGNNWTWIYGDTSNSFNTGIFAIYFVDADTGFVFGNDGQLARTTDGGNTWNAKIMDDYIGGYLDIFGFTAVTFTDKNTGWLIGSGYYGNELFKTTDCGRSWVWDYQAFNSVDYALHDICFINKNQGYILGNVLYETTDGGTTWQLKNPDNEEGPYSSVAFTDSLTGWVIGGETGNSIYKTTDGGNNWTIITDSALSSPDQLFKVRFADNNNGWIVGQNGIIYRTTDSGINWISQRDAIHNFYSIYFIDENRGWAVGDSGIVLHTTNGGDNWEIQYHEDDLLWRSVYAADSQNIIVTGCEITGTWPSYTYIAVILQTTDGGQIWNKQIIDKSGSLNSICFPSKEIGWAVGGQILKTSDGGETWHVQSNLANLQHVQFIDSNTGWVGIGYQSDNNLYKTTDGGNTWVSQIIDTNIVMYSFYFINYNIGWAVGDYDQGQGRNIYKTTNGGQSWSLCHNNILGGSYSSVYFINENTGWAAGSNSFTSEIIKTTDGGNTWVPQICPTPNAFSNIFMLDGTIGWAAGTGIFKTTDGGGIAAVKSAPKNGNLPKQITLYQNYPNPFNPSTIISWKLTSSSHVTLKVYDILGREITTLVNKNIDAGSYNVSWNASKLASGVYFYRLQVNSFNNNQSGNFIETKKMMLIR
jgi:photosystem II stability/assembly factor-like uncharacterized protein